jgi:membrane-associated PAP2 superfamily phosphatase
MNGTGLTIALTLAVLVGGVFGFYPELDLKLAALFFDPEAKRFTNYFYPWLGPIREAAMWIVAAFAAPAVFALVFKLIKPRRPLLVSGRAIVFLLTTLALGPGLVVNMGLKEHWGRSRPIDVPQLAGPERFTPWWDPSGICPKNCSFVSGDTSGAYWLLAPAALAPPQWRAAAYAGAVAFGAGVGLLRMAFGGHFFTDTVFAGIFVFLIIWIVHGLIYRWPRTRLSDEAIDGALKRWVLSSYAFWAGLFGRRPTSSGS